MITISEAMAAYSICARAKVKSPRTMEWILASMKYFMNFLGGDREIATTSADDLRRFIIELQGSRRFRQHPIVRPQQDNLSPQTVETYVRGIRAFFSTLHREGLLDENPMLKVKVPRVPKKVAPTFSDKEVERLLARDIYLRPRNPANQGTVVALACGHKRDLRQRPAILERSNACSAFHGLGGVAIYRA